MADKDISTCLPCGLHTPKRSHYTDGALLTARDFQAEQDYHRGHRQRHNALLHGTGTVCGLKIIEHPSDGCQRSHLVIEPGLALDCCGREIVVPERTLIEVADYLRAHPELRERLNGERHLTVGLRRVDTGADPVPTILPGCDAPDGLQFSRVCEGFEVVLGAVDNAAAQARVFSAMPALKWENTLPFEAEAPFHVAVNDTENRVQVSVQNAADDGTGRLHFFDTLTHDLTAIAEGAPIIGQTTAAQTDGLAFAAIDGANGGVAVWRATDVADSAQPQGVIRTNGRVQRLAVSPSTGELFVLASVSGTLTSLTSHTREALTRWLAGDTSTTQPDKLVTARIEHSVGDFVDDESPENFRLPASLMDISTDSRWLLISSGAPAKEKQVYLIDIAKLHEDSVGGGGDLVGSGNKLEVAARIQGFDLPNTVRDDYRLRALRFSPDSGFIYVAASLADQTYVGRFAITNDGNRVEKRGRGAVLGLNTQDMLLSPTEIALYLVGRTAGGTHGPDARSRLNRCAPSPSRRSTWTFTPTPWRSTACR